MAKGIGGRSTLAAPQRGESARADRSAGKASRVPRTAIRLRAETGDPDDRGDDTIAMRKNPARQGKNRDRDGGTACERRAQPEEHRPAKRVVEARERGAGQSRVEQFHRRNDDRREQHRCGGKERGAPPTRCGCGRKRSMGRHVTAEPQAVQSDRTGDQRGDRDDQPARVVTGNVVVARVRDKIVGDDVNRTVRHDGRGGGSSDHQRDQRARNDGHWCADSGPLPLPPRESRQGSQVVAAGRTLAAPGLPARYDVQTT